MCLEIRQNNYLEFCRRTVLFLLLYSNIKLVRAKHMHVQVYKMVAWCGFSAVRSPTCNTFACESLASGSLHHRTRASIMIRRDTSSEWILEVGEWAVWLKLSSFAHNQ